MGSVKLVRSSRRFITWPLQKDIIPATYITYECLRGETDLLTGDADLDLPLGLLVLRRGLPDLPLSPPLDPLLLRLDPDLSMTNHNSMQITAGHK